MSDPAGPPRSRGTSQGRSIWFAAARAKRAERLRRSDGDFDQWVEAVTEGADPLMAWLGIVFALVVGFEIAADPSRRTAQLLEWTGWTIWAVFLLEFLAKLWLAPRRVRFMRKHWLQAAALVVPTLRVLRFVRLLRLGRALPAARVVSSSYRSVGTAQRLFRSRLAYLAASALVAAIAIAELAFLFERDRREPAFDSFGDALLWSLSTVLALQADPVPGSVGGRVAMLAGSLIGVVVVASLAGTIGAYLLETRRERAEYEPEPDAPTDEAPSRAALERGARPVSATNSRAHDRHTREAEQAHAVDVPRRVTQPKDAAQDPRAIGAAADP